MRWDGRHPCANPPLPDIIKNVMGFDDSQRNRSLRFESKWSIRVSLEESNMNSDT